MWGIEEVDPSRPIVVRGADRCYDVLGIRNAGSCNIGADNITALAAIKKSTSMIILAFDNDMAGLKARERAADMLGRFRCRYIDFPEGVDINEMHMQLENKDRLIEWVKENTKELRT